jgi:hypothetical protein
MKTVKLWMLVVVLLAFHVTPVFAEENPAFRNVTVAEPKLQFSIQGEARVWGGVFHYQVKAGDQVIQNGVRTISTGAPNWGGFQLDLSLKKSQVQGKNLVLELYEKSMKDGSNLNQLTVPLNQLENNVYQNQAFRNVTGQAKYIYQVQGEARVFEANYHFEVSDGHDVLVQGYGTSTHGAPEWGTFQETIEIPRSSVPINGTLLLELYEPNMSDQGSPRLHSYFLALDSFPW